MKNVLKISIFLSILTLFGASHVLAMNLNFSANTTQITAGEAFIMSWDTNSPPALDCQIRDNKGWLGGGGSSGQLYPIYPKASVNYTIYCEYWRSDGSNHDSATQTISVSVNGAPYPTPTSYYYPYPTPTPTPYYYYQPQYNSQPQSLKAACATSPASPKTGSAVTFAAAASGGIAPYTYAWSGAVSGTGQSIDTSFSEPGTKTATVVARDSSGRAVQSSCSVPVVANTPNPAPTPTPKPSPAAKPTPVPSATETGKVEGVSTACKQITVCFDQATGKITETLPTPSGVGTPTQPPAIVGAATPASTSKNNAKSVSPSLFASIFNIKGDVGGKIKSLVVWYAVILLVILLVVFSYMGIKKIKNKKEAEKLDQQKRSA